ncbi:MAG: hypothetical protein HFG22_14445 [Lachnospiraceae bacterium]|nr:hypothetical protein [Lachnospiraceae bacterium]
MSFMFKPLAYDDMRAVNRIKLPEGLCQRVLEDCGDIAAHILHAGGLPGKKTVIGVDGYIGAQFGALLDAIETCASAMGLSFRSVDMRRIYKTKEEIDRLTAKNLPEDREEDPVLLFGRLYKGTIDDFLDQEKAAALLKEPSQDVTVVYGHGSCAASMRPYLDRLAYIDVTPKVTVIRAREGKVVNIGDTIPRPFPLLMRRGYFVDFEVEVKLRRELLQQDLLDFYLLGNEEGRYQMMGAQDLEQIVDRLVKYPFRAKPVYLEGIWGGEFIRKARRLPKDIAENIAWIFEFIPMEVSIVVDLGEKLVDIPFSTFVQKKGVEMMGQHCVDEFDGYFPIRFNYDDTWHSNGNMSIQVHPDEDFVIEQYDEFGRQDEAYYVIATGHGARTYCGFKGRAEEFIQLAERAEKEGEAVDYQQYIHSIESIPGRQIMLPAGTVHASGRNQFILELGSLTIGSYTYKIYDYNRKDKDGKLRPIHMKNAKKVLRKERDPAWVEENVAIAPICLQQSGDYTEYVVGKTDLMYYETHRIEIKTHGRYEGKNNGQFTVLTVVDGEQIRVFSRSDPGYAYTADFLDVVTVPASIEDYVIEAKGYQPVVVHKTILRDGYTRYKNEAYKARSGGR